MSEVNADGVLLNPHEALLQEVQALTNSPDGRASQREWRTIRAHRIRRQRRGRQGGGRRSPTPSRPWPPGGPRGAGTGSYAAGAPARLRPKEGRPGRLKRRKPKPPPTEGGGGTGTTQTDD